MQRTSQTIGAISSALAKAQSDLSNPEKTLTATIRSPFPREGERTFRYASLANGLDIIRKCLGQHEIATVQTTAIDPSSGLICLTTLLAHTSGEWISSDWPVCPVGETASPRRMGAALTYARRYGLFTLVGIAGEDDLDAPDLPIEPIEPASEPRAQRSRKPPSNGSVHKPILAQTPSAVLRDQLIAEINGLNEEDALALWAHRRLAAKNTLTAEDAGAVEDAYLAILSAQTSLASAASVEGGVALPQSEASGSANESSESPTPQVDHSPRTATPGTGRARNKAHLRFVAAQPCLVCQRSPCDAHHLRFAQPRALGRKVSDEYTVPLCRDHHHQLHRYGNEMAWWANLKLAPLQTAKHLWLATLSLRDEHGPALSDSS
jgi:hypothetical protein